jgi:hypothetical protein
MLLLVVALGLTAVATAILIATLNRGAPGGALSMPGGAGTSAYASLGMTAPRYDRVADIVAAMERGGASCENLQGRIATTGQRERAACKSSGDDVSIRIFDGTDARNTYLTQTVAVLKQSQQEMVPTLAGPNWLVSADSTSTIDTFQRAIGGEVLP